MKGNGPMSALVLILALTMACGSENQGGLGPGGATGYDRMYDPKTVETVSGGVISVNKITDRGLDYGATLTLKTGKEAILVYLGPDWFLEKQDLAFAPRIRWRSPAPKSPFKGNRLSSPRRCGRATRA